MDDNSNIIIPFLSEYFLYRAGFLFPTISVFCGWIFYYGLGHNTEGDLPTISVSFIQFPENRLFAVCMCIESCILGAIFYIRHKLIYKMNKRYSQRSTEESTKQHKEMKINTLSQVCDVLSFTICFSLSGLSLFTLEDSHFIHLFFSRIFFISFILYYIISDIVALKVHFSIGFLSLILPYCTFCFVIVAIVIIARFPSSDFLKAKNTAAFCQYIAGFLLFLKVMLMGYDNPPHDFVSCSSKMKVKLA